MRPINTVGSKRIEKTHVSFKNRHESYIALEVSYGHHCGQVTSRENEWLLGGCSVLFLDLGADNLGITKQIANKI